MRNALSVLIKCTEMALVVYNCHKGWLSVLFCSNVASRPINSLNANKAYTDRWCLLGSIFPQWFDS